jgi:hypothetical protein
MLTTARPNKRLKLAAEPPSIKWTLRPNKEVSVPRAGPKKVQRYSLEFKRMAVKLSQRSGIQVQAVAEASQDRTASDFSPLAVRPSFQS